MSVKIKVDNTLALELIDYHHAEPMYQLVKLNRLHLREFLPWVDNMRSVDDFRKYINSSKLRYTNHTELGYVIMAGEVMIGRVGMHNIDVNNKSGSIGYWLAKNWVGQGIITRCCKALIDECFMHLQFNRIEIRAATTNYKSQAIPERLGFKKEGIIRQGEFVNDHFVDLYVYSMLKEEWKRKG
jgi:ribosomal-protein-serine acetyltransferase